jgi:hypothetical protein
MLRVGALGRLVGHICLCLIRRGGMGSRRLLVGLGPVGRWKPASEASLGEIEALVGARARHDDCVPVRRRRAAK